MTRVKKIFALTIALALVFALCSPSTYAISPRQFGAWIASALTAINITWNSTVAPAINFIDYLDSPFQITDNSMNYVPYTHEKDDDILSRSTLSINGNKVTIDGIEYTDIWLSHDASEKFRVNAFDIENAWDIASQSEGTFVSGAGFAEGEPIYQLGNNLESVKYTVPGTIGHYSVMAGLDAQVYSGAYGNLYTSLGGKSDFSSGNMAYPQKVWFRCQPNGIINIYGSNSAGGQIRNYVYKTSGYIAQPFDFDWVASDIPAEILPDNEGLHMLVPSNPEQWTDYPATQTTINNINNFFQVNPEFSPDTDIDLSTPGIIDKLDDLFDIISNIIQLTKPHFGTKDDQPEPEPQPPEPEPAPYPDPEPVPYPDPDPEPGTSLPDIDWTELFKTIKNIFQSIVDGNVIKQVIANINTDIRNIMDNIRWQIEQIREQIGDIADKIIHGNKDWFKDIVDAIKLPFLPWINAFKTGVGIWHYVVEWVTYISAPFSYFFNVASTISYNLVLPIYALIAGSIVIAIYRRFGR